MNCERAMELLATGSALGRLRARRHAARCPRCGADALRLTRLAEALAAVEPLTAAQRSLWTSASTEPRPYKAREFWPRRVRLAASAAVCIVGIAIAFTALRPTPVKPPIKSPVPQIATEEKPQRQSSPEMIHELDSLTSDLQALSRELAQLSRSAELLDERRDAEALARRFVAMNSP